MLGSCVIQSATLIESLLFSSPMMHDIPHLLSVDDDSCRCVCDCVICSLFTDLKTLNESIRNLKAIELMYPPVETVLSALSGQVEEFRLNLQNEVCYPLQCLCTSSVLHTSGTCVLHTPGACVLHTSGTCVLHTSGTCVLHTSGACVLHTSGTCVLHTSGTCVLHTSGTCVLHTQPYSMCTHTQLYTVPVLYPCTPVLGQRVSEQMSAWSAYPHGCHGYSNVCTVLCSGCVLWCQDSK